MNEQLVEVGATFDVAIFDGGLPAVLVTCEQTAFNIVSCHVHAFGDLDPEGIEKLLALVVGAIEKHCAWYDAKGIPLGDDPAEAPF